MLRARSLSISACGFLGPWRNHERPPSRRSMGASGGYSATPVPGIPPASLQRNARRKSANAGQGRGRCRHTRARGRSAGVGFRGRRPTSPHGPSVQDPGTMRNALLRACRCMGRTCGWMRCNRRTYRGVVARLTSASRPGEYNGGGCLCAMLL